MTRDAADGEQGTRVHAATRESAGATERGVLLLVCATAAELRATLAPAPGGNDIVLPAEARPPFAGTETALPVLRLARCDVYLLVCGVGPVAAALSLGACLGGFMRIARREMPDGVINTGLAGSYDPDKAPAGRLLAVDEEYFPEYGVRGEAGVLSTLHLPQLVTDAGPVYTRLALDPDAALTRVLPALGKTPESRHSILALCTRGAALTVAGISGDPAQAARTAQLCGGLAETMEGFALALACAAARVPFAEFRAVSNVAGYRPPHTWKTSDALAALSRLGAELFLPGGNA